MAVREGASVWYGAVLRGDTNAVDVGAWSNVQDRAVITANGGHSEETGLPLSTRIGNFVTVGHGAVVSSAQIDDEVIIGMGAVVGEGAVVEKHSIVAAGAVVPAGARIPSGQVWGGNPIRYLRDVTHDEETEFKTAAREYAKVADAHKEEFVPAQVE